MNTITITKRLLARVLIACLTAQPALAAATDISNTPLASAGAGSVLPNLLFTLDASGSMAWTFMPDYVDPYTPGSSETSFPCMNTSPTSGSTATRCLPGDPPYTAGGQNAFNGVAYDPNLTYLPGLSSTGTTVLPSSSFPPSTYSIPNDAYGTVSGTTDITGQISDRQYCNSSPGSACRRNGADTSGNVLAATKDPYGNSLGAGQFPYRTNPSNASDPTVISFGLPEMMSMATFTGNGSFVTATTVEAHGLTTSDKVYVTGTSNVNVSCAQITGTTTTTTFTYSSSGSATNASGSYRKCVQVTAGASTGFSTNGSTVTVQMPSGSPHGLVTGDVVAVVTGNSNIDTSGAAITWVSTTKFTYSKSGSSVSTPIAGSWVRTGLYNVASTVTGPAISYYITPTEWCADATLITCTRATPPPGAPATAPNGFPFPAYVRFCQNQALALAPATAISGNDASGRPLCIGKFVDSGILSGVAYQYPRYGWFTRDTIKNPSLTGGSNSYVNRPARTDTGCSGGTCTYAAEIANYANWFAYYQTRIQMMKTSVGRAFVGFVSNGTTVPDMLRVGFITINPFYTNASGGGSAQSTVQSSRYLKISNFNAAQASSWYSKLYSQFAGQSTPLRTALSRAGWIFAGKLNQGITAGIPVADDPMQVSCQRNFLLMTTDGFWNGTGGVDIANNAIQNLDDVDPTLVSPYTQVMVDRSTTVTFDGMGASTTTTTSQTTQEQQICTGSSTTTFGTSNGSQTSCPCTGNYKTIVEADTTASTSTTSTEGVPGSPTTSSSTTFNKNVLSPQCQALVVEQKITPVIVTEVKTCSGNNTVTFADGSTKACGCSSGKKINIKETRTGATEIIDTVDGVTGSPSFSGGTTTYTYSQSGSGFTSTETCASSITATTVAQNVNTAGSTTTTTTSGSTVTTANFTISPNPKTNSATTSASTTPGGAANTLADAAMYYYQTDLRGGTDIYGNATGPAISGSSGIDVSPNNIPVASGASDFVNAQHMVTFTLGMADGLMRYVPNYASASSTGDFAKIRGKQTGCFWTPPGSFCDWPKPSGDDPQALDDLWHAAVNGRGQYYQALNAKALTAGLTGALNQLSTTVASAAAAATSAPNLTPLNNQAFNTTYETTTWAGKFYMQFLDPATAQPQPTIQWQADTQLMSMVSSSSNATVYSGATSTGDTRNIFTFDPTSSSGVKSLQWGNLSSAEQAWFQNGCTNTLVSVLSQCTGSGALSSTDQGTVNAGPALLAFLRGWKGAEQISTCPTSPVGFCLFRNRVFTDLTTNPPSATPTVLGDMVDAKPVFVGAPTNSYSDVVTPNYATYQAANANRAGRVFIGANDGYLHSFDANTGNEVWAYAPRFVLPYMYTLADTLYSGKHRYFVDGTATVGDVFDKTNSVWRTILVSGTAAGGRGFFALDVTDPNNPKGLWEICANPTTPTAITACSNNDADLGLSYGNPVIGKRAFDGRWVVVLTSGLNNVSPGTGGGFFYILDAVTGQLLNKVATNGTSGVNVGTSTTPSGLMKISAFYNNPLTDATFQYVYGGDQLGNVWRLDVGASKPVVTHMATLMDKPTTSSPRTQPITTQPVLTFINSSQRVLYIGTGRYLGLSDLSDPGAASGIAWQQSLYAFKDKGSDYGNIRDDSNMVVQTLTSLSPTTRGISGTNTVNWTSQDGWLIDFNPTFPGDPPAGNTPGERLVINMQLVLGTLIATTTVPNVTGSVSCVSGGFSIQYQLDFKSGLPVAGTVAGTNLGQLVVGSTPVETTTGQIYDLNKFLTGGFQPTGVNINQSGTGVKRFSYRVF